MTPEQKSAYIIAQSACAIAEIESMKSLNKYREMSGATIAYDEKAFLAVPDKYGISHNSVLSLFHYRREVGMETPFRPGIAGLEEYLQSAKEHPSNKIINQLQSEKAALREEIKLRDESEKICLRQLGDYLNKADSFRERLARIVEYIQKAPHQMGCSSLKDSVPRDLCGELILCDCWKREAIAAAKEEK